MQYLGYLISKDGVQPDPSKVEAVTSYPTPSNATEVREFLGIANYYQRFVEGFSAIATPLYQQTRKTASGFLWTPECQKAFDQLKQKLVSPPILAYPQFDVPFVVQTDASAHAVGGVLSQVQDGKKCVIAYWSQELKKAERNYTVVGAIKEFYPYLYGFPFQLHTDHNPLVSLKTVKDFGGRVSRWMLLLQQFDFTVVYKPGTSNGNADCLSRRPTANPPEELAKTSQGVPTAMATPAVTKEHQPPDGHNSICQQQDKDEVLMAVKTAIQQGSPLPREFRNQRDNLVIEEGCLYCRHTVTPLALPDLQVVVPRSLQPTILEQLHNEGGHLGTHKTAEKLRERYYWPDYMTDVEKWVKECEQRQRRNSPRRRHRPLWRPFRLNIHSRKSHGKSWGHYQCQLRVTSTSWS